MYDADLLHPTDEMHHLVSLHHCQGANSQSTLHLEFLNQKSRRVQYTHAARGCILYGSPQGAGMHGSRQVAVLFDHEFLQKLRLKHLQNVGTSPLLTISLYQAMPASHAGEQAALLLL